MSPVYMTKEKKDKKHSEKNKQYLQYTKKTNKHLYIFVLRKQYVMINQMA